VGGAASRASPDAEKDSRRRATTSVLPGNLDIVIVNGTKIFERSTIHGCQGKSNEWNEADVPTLRHAPRSFVSQLAQESSMAAVTDLPAYSI
jgi:hypothetical protein